MSTITRITSPLKLILVLLQTLSYFPTKKPILKGHFKSTHYPEGSGILGHSNFKQQGYRSLNLKTSVAPEGSPGGRVLEVIHQEICSFTILELHQERKSFHSKLLAVQFLIPSSFISRRPECSIKGLETEKKTLFRSQLINMIDKETHHIRYQ